MAIDDNQRYDEGDIELDMITVAVILWYDGRKEDNRSGEFSAFCIYGYNPLRTKLYYLLQDMWF